MGILLLCVLLGLSSHSAHAADESWESFWSRARTASPRVQVLENRIRQVRSEVALEVPPPMVAAGSTGEGGPFSGIMEQTYEISQKVPFPSRFFTAASLKGERINQRSAEADAKLAELRLEAYRQFVDLDELLARRKLLEDKRVFFDSHLKRLQAYTISEQEQQLHILEVEALLSGLDADLKALKGEETALRLKLGTWLSTDGKAYASDPSLTEPDLERASPAGNPARSPYLKLSQANETLRDRERSFVRTSWLPDLSLTYRRHVRFDGVMPSSHELVAGLELPFLFPGQPAARSEQAGLMKEEASLENAQRNADIRAQAESLEARLSATREQLRLMKASILPNLEKRMHLLHRLAQTDMSSLELHRTTYEQLVSGYEKNLKLRSDFRKLLLEREVLLGGAK